MSILELGDAAMLKFSYSHKEPRLALGLLTWLYAEADVFLRGEVREAARRQVAYAAERLASISVPGLDGIKGSENNGGSSESRPA